MCTIKQQFTKHANTTTSITQIIIRLHKISSMSAIETQNLTKKFGNVTAVNDISFKVKTGEIFGFLGPNGAGKSTTIMMLTTLLGPSSGEAYVGGYSTTKEPKKVREKIGYVQQDTSVDEYMTGRENLHLHARLSHISKDVAESRIDEMLQLVELEEKQHDYVNGYSGGMRKRLDIAGGLLHMPDVLFLDEPTVGLDIQTRRKIWNYIKKIHIEYNVTVFLTTHYMEEADNLCDRIGIIDWGKIIIIDEPARMKNALGNEIISITMSSKNHDMELQLQNMTDMLSNLHHDHANKTITMIASNGTESVPKIFQAASKCGAVIDNINVTRPTLDDVFLHHTGHEIRDEENTGFNQRRETAKKKRNRGKI